MPASAKGVVWGSVEDHTLAWGPIALCMCEAEAPPEGENPYNCVHGRDTGHA